MSAFDQLEAEFNRFVAIGRARPLTAAESAELDRLCARRTLYRHRIKGQLARARAKLARLERQAALL